MTLENAEKACRKEETGQQSCINCAYFRLDHELSFAHAKDGADDIADDQALLAGVCRRYPPVFVCESLDDPEENHINYWSQPAVAHCDTCGDFRKRKR